MQDWVIAKTSKPFLVKGRWPWRKWMGRGRVKSQGWDWTLG